MTCPVCDGTLREMEKHGVTVDICPQCKGVWLDRGELDKILQIAGAEGPTRERDIPARPEPSGYRDPDDDDELERTGRDRRGFSEGSDGYPQRKKRGSWLSDIFENFGGD